MEHRELIDSLFRERDSFNKLTKQQEEAVFSEMGVVCINSGAGTGKTHVLVNRIYHLLKNENIKPEKILAVSYTKKAAGEIRRRMKEEINLSDLDTKNIRTFHSLFREILTENISKINKNMEKFITISGEQKEIFIADICESLDISREYNDLICSAVSTLKRSDSFEEKLASISQKLSIPSEEIRRVYNTYCERLRDLMGLDFDDYEILVLKLFRDNPEIREKWKNKFEVICIDEFQDISLEQLEITKLLTGENPNIFVVGDPDQSIYGFRDINSSFLFDEFLKHYSNVSIVNLEQNFRSTKNILNIANTSMEKHPKHEKLYKKLWTDEGEGEPVLYKKFRNSTEEIGWVVERISDLVFQNGVAMEEIAILCRNNLPNRIRNDLCQDLKMLGLDVTCTSNKDDFLNLREIRYIISALNLSILDTPSYNHLETFLKSIWIDEKVNWEEVKEFTKWAKESGYTLSEATKNINQCQISSGTSSLLKRILGALNSQREKYKNDRIETLISKMLNYEGTIRNKVVRNTKSTRNIWKLIAKLKQYQEIYKLEDLIRAIPSFDFLPEDKIFADEEREDGIVISTIHKAKGLEFDYVFLIGMCSRYFPNSNKPVDKDEERRVAHVAYTRAKKQLIITCPSPNHEEESEFIDADIRNSPSFRILS